MKPQRPDPKDEGICPFSIMEAGVGGRAVVGSRGTLKVGGPVPMRILASTWMLATLNQEDSCLHFHWGLEK